MDIKEMLEMLSEKETEVRGFLKDNKIEDAKKVMEEVRGLKEKIEMAKELEKNELRDLQKQKEIKEKREVENMKVDEMRSLTKYVLGKEMEDEERALIKTSDNGAVIPKEFVNKVIELQKGYGSLKQYTDIIPITRGEGTIPVVDLDQNEMKDITEGSDIVDGTLVTTEVNFKCTKVGLKQQISNETLEDAVVSIENLITKNFANIATVKENKKILDVISKNATEVKGAKDYVDLELEIDKALPSTKAGLVTVTNVTSYCLLKNMKDKQGRNLDLITNINGVDYFHGKPILYVEDSLLTSAKEKANIFYILNMQEAVKFLDRKLITIKKWEDNDTDTEKMSVLERFDVVCGAKRSIKKIEY